MSKISLPNPLQPRDALNTTKDSGLKNAFIDKGAESLFMVKRPGFVVGSGAVTTGFSRGIYWDPYKAWLWMIGPNETPIQKPIGIQNWSPVTTYPAGAVVNGPYTSVRTTRGSKPPSADWSAPILVMSIQMNQPLGTIGYSPSDARFYYGTYPYDGSVQLHGYGYPSGIAEIGPTSLDWLYFTVIQNLGPTEYPSDSFAFYYPRVAGVTYYVYRTSTAWLLFGNTTLILSKPRHYMGYHVTATINPAGVDVIAFGANDIP